MPRPKKARQFNGAILAENLYPDSRERIGKWRYCRPNGTFKTFDAVDVAQANQIAQHNNKSRDQMSTARGKTTNGTLAAYIPEYIEHRQSQSPDLLTKKAGATENMP